MAGSPGITAGALVGSTAQALLVPGQWCRYGKPEAIAVLPSSGRSASDRLETMFDRFCRNADNIFMGLGRGARLVENDWLTNVGRAQHRFTLRDNAEQGIAGISCTSSTDSISRARPMGV